MAAVGILLHNGRPQAAELAHQAIAWLGDRGHEVRIPDDDAKATGLTRWTWPTDELTDGLALALSMGGDGTMLRTVDLVAAAGVPVLGVNVGHLGFLNQVEPEQLEDSLEQFFAGDYEVEERMTLQVRVEPGALPGVAGTAGTGLDLDSAAAVPVYVALNEAGVDRTLAGHIVRLSVGVGGRHFTTYAADGLIVATPTGSTAYNFSAGGPIVSPRQRSIVLTPVSPHQPFQRSLVLDPSEEVRIQVLDGQPAALMVDGRHRAGLAPGDVVVCAEGAVPARLVTFEPRNFLAILKAKFGLADR